jgi:ribonucleoside-triphosphate reductase
VDEKGHITGENAADRMTYVGEVFTIGERKRKQDILAKLPEAWSALHNGGDIHIHDLDAWGLTYNCLAVDLREFFPYDRFSALTVEAKIIGLFDFLKEFLTKLGNEQSGGMAFANFDIEVAEVFERIGISLENINDVLLRAAITSFYVWCNNSHERMGKVSYYVSLNIGLAETDYGKYICKVILEEFAKTEAIIFKPNIIFKVKSGVNADKTDGGYSLFQTALKTTAKKMIPTYLLCDAAPNKDIDPFTLAVMGCRTRVVADKHHKCGSIGRGNITNVSINLPRIALEIDRSGVADSEARVAYFLEAWEKLAATVSGILEARYKALIKGRTAEDFRTNQKYNLWCVPFADGSLDEIFKHGTLSIGFIGLSEAVEVLTGKKIQKDNKAYAVAEQIIKHMRAFADKKAQETRFNYSLLATSGEQLSGRFTELDGKRGFTHKVLKKGFYTNSFHMEVNSGLSAFDKITKDAPFHSYCNGGCISYVELREAPINNTVALEELITHAVESGTHYLGFNFDMDICAKCGATGVFDKCTQCGAEEIMRVRRVSGYLEIVDYFTSGKKKEVKNRTRNRIEDEEVI